MESKDEKQPIKVFCCTSSDMHPYECSHDDNCIHCKREKTKDHDPETCCLCNY